MNVRSVRKQESGRVCLQQAIPYVTSRPPRAQHDYNRALYDDRLHQFIVKADLPGLKKDDIRVSCENGVLTIEGERKSETETKDKDWHKVERSHGRFVRSLNLGQVVDQSRIKAQYKDGVLELALPKTETAKLKSIDIRVD